MTTESKTHTHVEHELYPTIKGVGTIVLNKRGDILVGTELNGKEENHRKQGQLSIPMETLKDFERKSPIALVRASLSEISNSATIGKLMQGLREVGHGGPIQLDMEGTQGALVVFRWIDNPDEMPFVEAVPSEFVNLTWMNTDLLLGSPNLRPYVSPFIEFAASNGMLNCMPTREIEALRQFNSDSYLKYRDLFPDVK